MTDAKNVFQNEPDISWGAAENQARMQDALARVRKELGKNYPLIINGESLQTGDIFDSLNPSFSSEVVGVMARASQAQAQKAVEAARKAWPGWRRTPAEKRAECLFKAAGIMRSRKFELIAWGVFEAGKTWRESEKDVAEAIDFLEFYGRQMIILSGERVTEPQIPAETNVSLYIPRGVCLVIGIWNFPWAINTGMIAASIVAGNTAIFKPASLTPVIGYKIVKIFEEAGLPAGVLNFVPGPGAEVGEFLVKHEDVNLIVLTGSYEAGLKIEKLAAEFPNKCGIKKTVLETGGKNAIIVDSDADIDEAVKGTLASWLGYQGQKCSACSRAIVLKDVYDTFVERLAEAAKSIEIGDPQDPGTYMSPLISADALKKVQSYVEIGKKEARLVLEREAPEELKKKGYFTGPALFADVSPTARIAQEEIFGPVLACIKVKSFDEAIEVANGTDYALTGGVFSRSPSHIEKAKIEFEAGNLYINRHITGAIVSRQPFGGHRASGTGPKAGGLDYLRAFMTEKLVCENVLRRGFAPADEKSK